ncbi:hypothetical protein COLSTE_01196 [Collinsella stercoris DSM 13279]|uniref:Uncharacterized protein n=1 Tax=Collinsella stercoris DSM 13279 TaxID=445975 RepID=B6GAU6_9ACTN|nr:hypothetical protein COLSTE_01196 [Collinsella stercoris DSM 13279]
MAACLILRVGAGPSRQGSRHLKLGTGTHLRCSRQGSQRSSSSLSRIGTCSNSKR